MRTKSITSKPTRKPARPSKPYGDFPLFPHASGRWAKKVRGQFEYFGSWVTDPSGEAAAKLWAEQKDDLLAGRRPRRVSDAGVTVKLAVNDFLNAKQQLVDSGELAQRSFDDYWATCTRVADTFGRGRIVEDLGAVDFREYRAKVAKTWGPVAVANEINRVRVLFKWVYESELIDKPLRFGPDFKRPSSKTLRKARAANGERMFEAGELRKILAAAGVQLRAMVLLGINCGLGNADCARLEFRHIDLEKKWLTFPRPKTGVPRRCPLWPETVEALKAAIAQRPTPMDETSKLVFITSQGQAWIAASGLNTALCHELTKILKKLGISRNGVNFYALRHTLETIGSGAKDQPALDTIMGHAPKANDMAAVYRERIDDHRLRDVAGHVHKWLFGSRKKSAQFSHLIKDTRQV
jgi:integrase